MTGRMLVRLYLFLIPVLLLLLPSVQDVIGATDIVCGPCGVPSRSHIIWLPASRPPCFHPGQPLFQWPVARCPSARKVRSPAFSVTEDGLVLAEQKICFFGGPQTMLFDFECENRPAKSFFRLAHAVYSKRSRFKRWARRRNPDANAIHFQQEKYVRELKEDVALDTLVVAVKASHASDQPVYYSMTAPQDSRSQNLFTLDTMSGEIKLAKSLDREVLDKHVLKVTAYERVDPTISASTTVVVHVIDVQDNSPIFEKDSYFGEIREDAPIGTTVLSVFARDLDAGDNGDVQYSLGDGAGSGLLTINAKSGVVQTAAPLDREDLSLIRLDVVASDRGQPSRSSTALIEITVVDVNDNAPVFERDAYNVTISENLALPAVIAKVKASDSDFGDNGKVHYSMASTSGVVMTIDYSTGEVTLRERIDAKNSPATVMIRAKDGSQPALSSTVTLTINIIDINDHKPTFIASQKSIVLEENVAVGEEVAKVYAIDEDSGPNARIKYSLEGTEDFMVDAENGKIRTTKLLDRENQSKYTFKIIASDMGTPPLNSSTTMEVLIKDINDNAPTFSQTEYNVSISEETPRGSQILVLKAIDQDEEQKITYRIEEAAKDVFSILDVGEQGAILSISGELRGHEQRIRLEISATDQGGLQGRCVVNVFVEDVNSPPYFVDHPFSVRIPEHSPLGFPVIAFKAEDHDRGANARVRYVVDSEYFKMDELSGELSVAADLDREERASLNVVVTASDSAEPPLNTSTQIEVILVDVNDNAPTFTSSHYAATISEDIPVGTSFLQVSAVDVDIGPNGMVDYFLNETSDSPGIELFRLDRTSGTLRVNSKLDREHLPIIVLPIFARDRGQPPRSSASLITLTLSDVNDNAPIFEQSSYDLYIAENSPVGTTVGTVVARDPDEGVNAEITFRIFGGADAKLFDIEVDSKQHGVVRILTRAEFDYEAKANKFFLEIQASSEQLSSTVPVRIHVSDVNDNKPTLKDFVVLINRFRNVAVPRQIAVVPAFDPDHNATLEFFFEPNELLEADKYTGKLSLKDEWRRNIDAIFKTCVSDGANTECATCRFLHVFVEDDWLRESFTLSLSSISIDDFWDPEVFQRLREALSTLGDWKPSDVHVISASQHSEGVVHASVAIVEHGHPVRGWRAVELAKEALKKLERMTLLSVDVVRDTSCAKEPCSHYGKCRQTLKFVGDMQTHETDNFVSQTLKTVDTFVCECPSGFTSSDARDLCDVRLDECYRGRCSNNGTCVALEEGFRCDCPPGWIGRRCEIALRPMTCVPGFCASDSVCELSDQRMVCRHCRHPRDDVDGRCRLRSVSFDSDGMLNLNVDLSRIEWRLEFRVATIAHRGILFFTGDKTSDFVEVSIVDRVLRAELSLGGEKAESRMDNDAENRVNDGEWHTVVVEFFDRTLTVSLDNCDAFTALILKQSPVCAARARIELPNKCADPSVPCFRFLDVYNGMFLGGRPGPSRQIEQAFSGCIANLTLNDELLDFSKMHEMHKVGRVMEGCRPRADFCKNDTCPTTSKCTNRWNGHNCRCPHVVHHHTECSIDQISTHARPISLLEEESFVLYKPGSISVPFALSMEFRTSRLDTQIIAIEFSQRNVFFKLDIDDGMIKFALSDSVAEVLAPEFTSKNWVHVDVFFTETSVRVVVDGIYTAELQAFLSDMSLDVVYTGLAPSTGHPSRFEGCVRNVEIDRRPISVHQKGKVRQGCIVPNRCSVEGVCPGESSCQRLWNKHRCVCHKGFVGDTCLAVCNLKNVCSGGSCIASNTTEGYECMCSAGKTGKNCEIVSPQAICPAGWWGEFPNCKKCSCQLHKGFQAQCDKKSGTCLCQKFNYPTINGCSKCECGFGAESAECSPTGHCKCLGESVGRRCDRCPHYDHVLDAKSLKCHKLSDRCPSEIERSVQWPTTVKGTTVRQSCPQGESGLATRKCMESGRWSDVNAWNCTRPEYSIMFDILESTKLLAMVQNATINEASIRGRNQQIAADAVTRIVEFETKLKVNARAHVKDVAFTADLVRTFGKVLSEQPPGDGIAMIRVLEAYAKSVYESHQQISFLSPFFVANEHIAFAFDNLDFGNVLPKFNNFVDARPRDFVKVNIIVQKATQVLYAIVPYPRCPRCVGPLVVVETNTTEPILVEFPLVEKDDWRYPECVQLQDENWVAGTLVGLNMSHVSCQFAQSGIFSMFVNDEKGSYVRISHPPAMTPPILAAISLVFCALSLLATISRNSLQTQAIRIGFIIFFSLNLVNLYFIHTVSINQTICPLRNAIVSLTTCAPFAWLFLYSLHLYRMLADNSARSSATVHLLFGVAVPCVIACTTFFFTDSCSLSPNYWLVWFILAPIGLFILLSFYASATCFIVSMNKNYDYFVVKFNLRKALLHHFVLTTSTLVCTLFALATPLLPLPTELLDLVKSMLFLATSVVVLLWSVFSSHSNSRKDGVNMWLDPQKSALAESTVADRQCESPLLPQADTATSNDWMPDVIPSSQYMTTPRRAVEVSSHILSPAEKILNEGIGHVYGNMGTLPRLRSAQDDADDAYYSYTTSRRYKPVTFNRD